MLGLLPWEEWLPPYIVGPALCLISILAIVFDPSLSWWEYLVLPFGGIFGAWGTWVWFSTGRNVFRLSEKKPAENLESKSDKP
ncbi:MAG: hypothetical protein PHH47_07370 [Gallionella sp.]|nr:hypothetical protein [Gallionella sp.]MDD4947758.1 hypothetical protein [Gallionella sp.]